MVSLQNELILWIGEKHCGKTTSAANLVEIARAEGFNIAGILAPSIYNDSKLIGFDTLNLRNENRAPLARREINTSNTGPFTFIADGLKLGKDALSADATKSADLVIIDEFGPLELNGKGWRKNVDSLLTTNNAVILLVIRQELADEVQQLYADFPCRKLAATEPRSIVKVIRILKKHRQSQ
jgi:nucleoside-triphosphatase THEP1